MTLIKQIFADRFRYINISIEHLNGAFLKYFGILLPSPLRRGAGPKDSFGGVRLTKNINLSTSS